VPHGFYLVPILGVLRVWTRGGQGGRAQMWPMASSVVILRLSIAVPVKKAQRGGKSVRASAWRPEHGSRNRKLNRSSDSEKGVFKGSKESSDL